MKKRAIIYARVSTKEQKKGYSLDSQIKDCQLYSERNDMKVVAIFKDEISGATQISERRDGQKLLNLVENGETDAVIVWRLDRLSRPPNDEPSRLLTTYEWFAKLGVDLHSLETGRIEGSMGAVTVFFKGVGASEERTAMRKRSMMGRLAKAQSGKWVGAGIAPYGFRKISQGRNTYLEIDEEQAAVIKRIFDMYLGLNGETRHSLRAIADRLNAEGIPNVTGKGRWWPAVIKDRIIKRRTCLGEFTYRDVVSYIPELAFLDETTWQMAQDRLEKNKRLSRRNQKYQYLLSGMVVCSCGKRMCGGTFGNSKDNKHKYYFCNYRHLHGKYTNCRQPYLPGNDLEQKVWERIEDFFRNDEQLEVGLSRLIEQTSKNLRPTKKRLTTIDELLVKTKSKKRGLLMAFENENDQDVQEIIRQCMQIEKSLKRERAGLVATLERGEITPQMKDEVKSMALSVRQRLNNGQGTFERKRELLDALDVLVSIKLDGSFDVNCLLGPIENSSSSA